MKASETVHNDDDEPTNVPPAGMYVDENGKLWRLFAIRCSAMETTEVQVNFVAVPHGWNGDALKPKPTGLAILYDEIRDIHSLVCWRPAATDAAGKPYARPLRVKPHNVHVIHASWVWITYCASCNKMIGGEVIGYATAAKRSALHNENVHDCGQSE